MLYLGFITLSRELLEWRWYSDIKTTRVFVHLLLTANYEDHGFRERIVKRGQRIITYSGMGIELNLSVSEIRTALDHLKLSGDVTIESNNLYSIITIHSYEKFVGTTNENMSNSNEIANKQRQCNNKKKDKKDKNDKKEKKTTSYDINEVKKIDTLDFIN